jgi:hypothetical protein
VGAAVIPGPVAASDLPPSAPSLSPSPSPPTRRDRLVALFAEYGKLAVIVYLVLSLATIAGFAVALATGWEPSSATGVLGVLGAAWLAAKATIPVRIVVTLVVTPPLAALLRRRGPHGRYGSVSEMTRLRA